MPSQGQAWISSRSGSELGIFFDVEMIRRHECLGRVQAFLAGRGVPFTLLPASELAGYFRKFLRGIASKLGSLLVDDDDRSSFAAVGTASTTAFADGYDCSILRGSS